MHAVIGTAGHVDHGKSALIEALTGTHPSHLPQEISRGMTIDLGFACLRSAGGDEIGIIDVPGHERFLRNMLCSLWGLDLVLFVVAADEGWAPLSQEHLRVINALGIRQIMVVLTKCDLVNSTCLGQVEEQILEHFLTECNLLPDIWRVSARTGAGIEALRQGVIAQIQRLPATTPLSTSPHLYIDRVFSVNGIGTTVTGTLRGASVAVGDLLRLFPGNQQVKVKSIQSYHLPREQAQPCSRVAMSFRQLKKESVARGNCLAPPDADIATRREWIIQLREQGSLSKKQCQLEVALGTCHTQGRCYLLGDGSLARLLLSTALPVFLGQNLLLMSPGGSRMVASGRVVWSGPLNREQRLRLLHVLNHAAQAEMNHLRSRIRLAVNGFVNVPGGENPPVDCYRLGTWWLTQEYRQQCLNSLHRQLSEATSALSATGLAARLTIPPDLVLALVSEQLQAGVWQQSEQGISLAGAEFGRLSHAQQQLLDEIRHAGRSCFSATQHTRPGLAQQLKVLTEKKYIVPMDDRLFITREAYQTLLEMVFAECQQGDLLSIADVREITGLARKQLIPLLNRMERDGWVKREGDLRRVKKICHMTPA